MATPGSNALSGAIINVTGAATGLAQSTGLLSQLEGQPSRVQFIKPPLGCVLYFDAVINQNHQATATPTMFPVENGSVISDHVIQNPIALSITGIVSDTPLPDTVSGQLLQTFGAAAATLLPPLGVTTASTAFSLYQQADLALGNTTKRSKDAYGILMSLMTGNRNANPPTPPEPFTVLTKYARFTNMCITNITVPVDASTDGQLVVTVDMVQLVRVAPQVIKLSSLSNAVLAAAKVDAGAQDVENDEILQAAKRGYHTTYDPLAKVGDRLLGVTGGS